MTTETRITRDNIKSFKTFRVDNPKDTAFIAKHGGIYTLEHDDGSTILKFRHVSGPRPDNDSGDDTCWIRFAHLVGVEPAKSPRKFKVGDRVAVKRNRASGASVDAGDIGTVTEVYGTAGDGSYEVRMDVWRGFGTTPCDWSFDGGDLVPAPAPAPAPMTLPPSITVEVETKKVETQTFTTSCLRFAVVVGSEVKAMFQWVDHAREHARRAYSASVGPRVIDLQTGKDFTT